MMIAALALAGTAVAVAGTAAPARADPARPRPRSAASGDARFRALYTAEWTWRKRQFADGEDSGDRITAYLPDVGPAAQAARLARWTQTMAALDRIDTARLSPAARENLAVYRYQIATLLAAQRFRDYERPLNSDSSFWGDLAGAAKATFRTEADYRAYLTMLAAMPRYVDQQIANMRAGLARGFTPPAVTLKGRDESVVPATRATPDANPYYAPFAAMPATLPAATQAALRAAGARAIAASVAPAHQRLLAFLRTDYIPHAQPALDAYALPDGRAYYASKIREFTTRDGDTAASIHATGLAEIATIRGEMDAVMREVGFKGDLPAFLGYLRTDPRFYPKTANELLYRAAWIAKTFDGKAATYFGRLPRSRFAIRPVPDEIAPFYTGGRGGPGIYLVNTYDLPSRPLYAQVALTLHESAPGHAFQMPLASETAGLPDFRRHGYISAYGEGWALYCERLGVEMGMYETPYDRFGMLSYQAWRAARLVVDTGIHAMGWSRARAQAYLRDNTALSEHEITTEVDRYIAWPGQALSYYIGQMAIQRERAKAERALGPRFDLRAFHDTILSLGSVPLPVMTARIDRFIADGGKGPYPVAE